MDKSYFVSEDGITWPDALVGQSTVRLNINFYGGESAFYDIGFAPSQYLSTGQSRIIGLESSPAGTGTIRTKEYRYTYGSDFTTGDYWGVGGPAFSANLQLSNRYWLRYNEVSWNEGLSTGSYGFEWWFDDSFGNDVYTYIIHDLSAYITKSSGQETIVGFVNTSVDYSTVTISNYSDLLFGAICTPTNVHIIIDGSIYSSHAVGEYYVYITPLNFTNISGTQSGSLKMYVGAFGESPTPSVTFSYDPKNIKFIEKHNGTAIGFSTTTEFNAVFAIRELDLPQDRWHNYQRTAERTV